MPWDFPASESCKSVKFIEGLLLGGAILILSHGAR